MKRRRLRQRNGRSSPERKKEKDGEGEKGL